MNTKLYPIAFKGGVTCILLTLLIWNTHWDSIFFHIKMLRPVSIILGISVYGFSCVLSIYRFSLTLHGLGKQFPWHILTRMNLIGFTFSQGLPSSIGGDAYRTWALKNYFAPKMGAQWGMAIRAIVMDRIFGLIGLIIALLIGASLSYADFLVFLPNFNGYKTALTLLGLGIIFWIVYKKIETSTKIRIYTTITQILRECRQIPYLKMMLTVTIGSVLNIGSFYWIAHDVGLSAPFVHLLVIIPLTLIISLLPISMAGWGVREGSLVGFFGVLGYQADVVLAFSLLIGVLQLIWAIPGAIWYVLKPHHSMSK